MKKRLHQEWEREPTEAELAEHSGMAEKKVKEYLSLIPEICSLDSPAGEDEDGGNGHAGEDVLKIHGANSFSFAGYLLPEEKEGWERKAETFGPSAEPATAGGRFGGV